MWLDENNLYILRNYTNNIMLLKEYSILIRNIHGYNMTSMTISLEWGI